MPAPNWRFLTLAVFVGIAAAAGVILIWVVGGPGALQSLRLPVRGAPAPSIDLAEKALAQHDTANAIRLAALAVERDSSNAQVDNRAGNVALEGGDAVAAERDYLLGESADNRFPWNFVELGQLYARQGKTSKADAQLRAAIATAPDAQFLHYDLGVVELEEHLYAAALADFKAELRRSPGYKPAIDGRARALAHLGTGAEAAVALQAATPLPLQRVTTPQARPTEPPEPPPTPRPKKTPKRKPVLAPSAEPTIVAVAGLPVTPEEPPATPSRPVWYKPKPVSTPRPLTDIAIDAQGYLLGVARDLNFTHALPVADPDQSSAELQRKLDAASSGARFDLEALLKVGTAALLSGRFSVASVAFVRAADGAPGDWRGPYLAGLVAQARGDSATARSYFSQAASRSSRPETYTSLAVVALQEGAGAEAYADAKRAAALDPGYGPGRFTAGVLALVQGDGPAAERHLAAAAALGGAPARTQYFLSSVTQRMGTSSTRQ